jgi:5-formyltetrahydrofolate cyclo-ligase
MQQDIIRKQAKTKLKLLSPQQRTTFSEQMTCLVLNKLNNLDNTTLKYAKHITCYWPTKYEINTIALINNLLSQKKSCYLPVINQQKNTLDFIKYTEHTQLIANKFGILEPKFQIEHKINPSDIDLVFIPVVAFDFAGHRIGSGAGLFDRSINTVDCPIIGLAYSVQHFANITPNPWDIKLNCIVTEKKWINCDKSI